MFETITHPQQRAFLAAFAQMGNVTRAAALAGISREAHYDWRANDADYAAAFDEATRIACGVLEDEAVRRAHEGVIEPFVYRGSVVMAPTGALDAEGKPAMEVLTRTRYSDKLMICLLGAWLPAKYARHIKTEHTASGTIRHTVDLSALSDEELSTLEQLSDKARRRSDHANPERVEELIEIPESGDDCGGTDAPEAKKD